MRETFADQLARVRMMSEGQDTWDLSDNDTAALQAVLSRLDYFEQWAGMMKTELSRLSDLCCEEDQDSIARALEGPQKETLHA